MTQASQIIVCLCVSIPFISYTNCDNVLGQLQREAGGSRGGGCTASLKVATRCQTTAPFFRAVHS